MKCKAQMEIVGLLIIVLLFSLGLLFTLRFVAKKSTTDVHQTFSQAQLASNTLNSLLETTTLEYSITDPLKACRKAGFSDLFRDCASSQSIDCDNDPTWRELNDQQVPDSCYWLHEAIADIFEDTFEEWLVPYYFAVYTEGDPYPMGWTRDLKYGGCEALSEGDLAEYALTTQAGVMTIQLKICD